MRQIARRLLLALIASSIAACASGGSAARPADSRADLITAEEIRRGQWPSVYEMIKNLRPRWLQSRGPDTILGTPGEVQAHLDDARLGGVGALRDIPVSGIEYVQFIDPTTSAARWGLNHGHGTVYVSTRPR